MAVAEIHRQTQHHLNSGDTVSIMQRQKKITNLEN